MISFQEYQEQAIATAIYPGQYSSLGLYYTALGLGEVGEVQGKIKKIIRDDNGVLTEEKREELAAELGDVLWYLAMLAEELNLGLDGIAEANLRKLASRKERGGLQGSGDNR